MVRTATIHDLREMMGEAPTDELAVDPSSEIPGTLEEADAEPAEGELIDGFDEDRTDQDVEGEADDDLPFSPPNTNVPQDALFFGKQFLEAPYLANVAEKLIGEHGFLGSLVNCEIRYFWKRKTGVSKGKLKIGFLVRGSGLLGHYSGADFICWLSASTARDAGFTDAQIEAAVFHQLLHVGEDDNGNWIKVGHDFEGFGPEVRVYGPWTEDLKVGRNAFASATQLGLDLDGDDEDADEGELTDDDLAELPV
jgi:hypothetical protein